MKKLILTGLLGAASLAAFGQGKIDLVNINKAGGFVQPIFAPNPASPTVQQVGAPAPTSYSGAYFNNIANGGTTAYGGTALTGAGYDMVLLYNLSPTASSISGMTVATITPFRTAASATASPAGGVVNVNGLQIQNTFGGTPISFAIGAFQVDPTIAAWEAANAGYTPAQLYTEALADFAAGNGQMGFSAVVDNLVLGGADSAGDPPTADASTAGGWTSFSLTTPVPTPEPSTIALAGLGAAGLLLFRRKK